MVKKLSEEDVLKLLLLVFAGFLLLVVSTLKGHSQEQTVHLHQWVETKAVKLYPVAAYDESHITSDCDSQYTKKFAHAKSSGDFHKAKDVEMILGTYQYCCKYQYYENGAMKSRDCDSGCIANARHSEERQRYDVKDGLIVGGLLLPDGLSALRNLIRGRR